MKLIEIATRRRVAIAMAAVTLVLFGLIGLQKLKVNLLPDLAYPTLTIRTEFIGSAPEEIETLITKPIEESVGVVKNVTAVKSVSRAGQSDVVLEFAWGTDMDRAGLEVREKLEVMQLPLQASRPLLLRFNPATDPIMRMGLNFEEGTEGFEIGELKTLRRLADEEIKKQLEPVEGVAAVKISGGLEDEVQILIDPGRLAQLNLPIADITRRLAEENVNVSAGRLEQGTQRYLVRTINQFTSVEEMGDLIVTTGSTRPVYLRDIASIEQGYKERKAIIRMDGREAVEIAIYKEGDANTVSVARSVKERLESVRERLPDGMRIVSVDDQSLFISQAISEVVMAALLGGLLAVMVIFVFLRDLRSTIIIAVAIPISIIATFFLMNQAGITLNIMSLGGIALATGLLVDNAIVVLENISRYRKQGLPITEAAIRGASEISAAVVASTLTTIAVFFPLAFVDGIAGQLFRDQALTVTFALIISLAVALTLIPMLVSRRAGAREKKSRLQDEAGGRLLKVLRKYYMRLLKSSLEHRFLVALISVVLMAASGYLLSGRGVELVPQMVQGRFDLSLEAAPGTPLRETDMLMQRVQAQALVGGQVAQVYGVSGSGNRIDANPTESGENIGNALVVMNPAGGTSAETATIRRLRQYVSGIPSVNVTVSRPELLSFDKPLEIEIVGYELDRLRTLSDEVLERMQQSDRFVDLESSMERGHPEIQIYFDQERAASLGLTVKSISDQVVSNVRGDIATRYSWRDRKIDVLVRAEEEDRQSVDDIRNLIINPRSDRPVTLASVADIVVTEGPAEIRRSGQERVALISANLAYGGLGEAVLEAHERIGGLKLPPQFSIRVTGQNEEMETSFRSLLFALALAVFLVYLVMASQFESLLHPFVILFSIPLALTGVAGALWLTDTRLSVIVFIGLIMLAGIVVNNAIVLVDLINQLRAEGIAKRDAIIKAAGLRLRPILMTTMTTVLGLLPLAVGLGEGAEMRAPMAITVIGGLSLATLLTLIVIPVMYSLLDRKKMVAVTPGSYDTGVLGESG
jgi:HAE1 family hydrophobic/amphiphilic exporter-1